MVENIHQLTYPDLEGAPYAKARYHYLFQIIFAESVAVDFCRTIAEFAPTKEAISFLLQQQKEEDMHLELLTEYVSSHAQPLVSVSPYLKKIDTMLQDSIARKEYVDSIFVQNFIIEGVNVSLLRELEHHADGALSQLITRILVDEVRHVEFGVSEIQRILKEDQSKDIRRKLLKTQRKALFFAIGFALNLMRDTKRVGIPMGEFMKKTVQEHRDRIERAGLPLPIFDNIFFGMTKIALSLF